MSIAYNMNRKPVKGLVHIFIASYNRKDYLKESIESALNQTYKKIHLIIIDDASTDGADEVIKKYKKQYPKIISAIYKDKNKGVCDSLNIAIRFCKKGEYFAFFSNDDIWAQDKIEKQKKAFEKNAKIGLVHTNAYFINHKGQRFGEVYSKASIAKLKLDNITENLFLKGNFICGPSVMVSYEALKYLDFQIPKEVGSTTDIYMWIAISSKFEIEYIWETLTAYRKHKDNIHLVSEIACEWETRISRIVSYAKYKSVRKYVNKNQYLSMLYQFKPVESLIKNNREKVFSFYDKLIENEFRSEFQEVNRQLGFRCLLVGVDKSKTKRMLKMNRIFDYSKIKYGINKYFAEKLCNDAYILKESNQLKLSQKKILHAIFVCPNVIVKKKYYGLIIRLLFGDKLVKRVLNGIR